MDITIHFQILAIFLLIASYTDIRYSKIPNWLTISGTIIGVVYHLLYSGLEGLLFSLLGFVVGFIPLLILYIFKALSAGDVKLFGAIGAIAGGEFTIYSLMYSVIFAGVIGVFILLFRKELIKRFISPLKNILFSIFIRSKGGLNELKKEDKLQFPFMYAVVPGVITSFLYF